MYKQSHLTICNLRQLQAYKDTKSKEKAKAIRLKTHTYTEEKHVPAKQLSYLTSIETT